MKNSIAIYVLIFCTLFTLNSCKKEESKTPNSTNNTNPPSNNPNQDGKDDNDNKDDNKSKLGIITFKMDGKTFETRSDFSHATYANLSSPRISISGIGDGITDPDGSNYDILIRLVDFNGVGKYKLNIASSDKSTESTGVMNIPKVGYYECAQRNTSSNGEAEVTEYIENVSIKGTFKFNASKKGTNGSGPASKVLEEGTFYVPIK
jgi:hypothetical protein